MNNEIYSWYYKARVKKIINICKEVKEMLSKKDIERLAVEMGLSGEYIKEKAEEVIELLMREMGIRITKETNILLGLDMNGPLTLTTDASLNPLTTVQKGICSIQSPNVIKMLMSGWDFQSLKKFREKIGIPELGIVGELGAVFNFMGDKIHEPCPIDIDIHYKMKRAFYIAVAEAGLKIASQGNSSTRVGCFYIEAESEDRGNLRNNPLYRDISTRTIFDVLEDIKSGAFEYNYDDENIRFEPSDENIIVMDYVLSQIFPLVSVRFKKRGKKIIFWRDSEDDPKFTFNDMKEFSKEVTPEGWKIYYNNDYCFDFVYIGDGVELNKEFTANELGKMIFGDEEFILFNIGDKESDTLRRENGLSFVMNGTEAKQHCKDKGIPHINVINGGDYGLIIAYILAMDQSENKNEKYKEDFDFFMKNRGEEE